MAKAISGRSRRKLSKKDLKEDKLVSIAYKAEHFFNVHRNRVVGTVVVVLVLIIGGILLQKTLLDARYEENFDLTRAKMAFGQDRYAEARAGLENVLSKYSGTIAAEAQYYLARVDFEEGKLAEAEAGFREYKSNFSSDKYMDCAVDAGLAASLEAQGKYEEAARLYEAVANDYPDLPYAPEGLTQAGRLYLQLNQNDNAIRVLSRIIEKYPDATVTASARKDLKRLQ